MDQTFDIAQRYDLFTLERAGRFAWQNKDRGVTLGPTAMSVLRGNRWISLPYRKIASIGLSTGSIGNFRSIAQCTVRLKSGRQLVITNTNARGMSDGLRDGLYREFVADFHDRLLADGAAQSITFRSGFSRGRMTGLVAALIAGAALFLLLPTLLLIFTHNLETLWALLAGVGLVFPAFRIATANQPATYLPNRPPDLLP
jgi:hypothetical protein